MAPLRRVAREPSSPIRNRAIAPERAPRAKYGAPAIEGALRQLRAKCMLSLARQRAPRIARLEQ
eukprot:4638016-Lingulodinium_polyedra.AAC.1